MNLHLYRFASTNDATFGALYMGRTFLCFTLEDEYRAEKVVGETRIPTGCYQIARVYQSGMLNRMKAAWYRKDWIPTLLDVPGFTHIRIHPGNTDKHTDGCIMPAYTAYAETMSTSDSRRAFMDLIEIMEPFFEQGEEVWITIEDGDR